MNTNNIVIHLESVVYMFLAFIFALTLIYIIYRLNKLEKIMSEGIHINLVQQQYDDNRIFEGDDYY